MFRFKHYKKLTKSIISIKFHSSQPFNLQKVFLKDKHTFYTFNNILNISKKLSQDILRSLDKKDDLNGEKIGVFCFNSYAYLCVTAIINLIY